eukprot:99199-Karenia_brevis.AAC.1
MFQWVCSKGVRGHLHVCTGSFGGGLYEVRCGRRLKNPTPGVGIEDAKSTNRPWPPRCFSKLPAAI